MTPAEPSAMDEVIRSYADECDYGPCDDTCQERIQLISAALGMIVPWLASQTDILASDWATAPVQ